MVARFENPFRFVARNEGGRDFVVGDIHGCFELVLRAMERVRFDQAKDRILSVGDLIDRGPGSARSARFLSHDWVVAVRGNHEDMVLEMYQDGEPHPAVVEFMACRNGFGWWTGATDSTRADVLEAVGKLPLAVEVDTPRGTVGLVHADVPRGMTWQAFRRALEYGDADVAQVALWGRDRLHANDESGVEGVGRLFVGHTPLSRLTRLGNVYAVDTGAVYGYAEAGEGALTFADACQSTNGFKALGSMRQPDALVEVFAQARRDERPFSTLPTPAR